VTWLDVGLVMIAASLLGLERACYVAVWRQPARFRDAVTAWAGPAADPVDALANLFVGFKALQAAVFFAWCLYFGELAAADAGSPDAGARRRHAAGRGGTMPQRRRVRAPRPHRVFYGNRFGHDVSWRYGFPFSWFRHPQYVGTVATIWGVFIALRWPNPDWIVLPLIETAYYVAGAWLEDDATPPPSNA
jgi:methylene-fatty-acyl-phospholipid synthase